MNYVFIWDQGYSGGFYFQAIMDFLFPNLAGWYHIRSAPHVQDFYDTETQLYMMRPLQNQKILWTHVTPHPTTAYPSVAEFLDNIQTFSAYQAVLYRDPRDVFTSYHKRNPSIEAYFGTFKEMLLQLSQPPSFNFQYEQLALMTQKTITHFLDYMQYPKDLEKISQLPTAVNRTGKVGQWVHYFNDEIEAEFKKHAGDIVSYLGYEVDENWSYKDYAHLNKDTMTEREYWLAKPRPIFTLPPENA